MGSGMALFAGVGVILWIAIYLNYKMSRHSIRHKADFEALVIKFDQAVYRNDLSEIKRIGQDLLYNSGVTLKVVNKIEANKKLRWNTLDDVARAKSMDLF